MRTGAQPAPINAIARLICNALLARAKSAAPPPPPNSSKTAAVRRGPTRSSAQPTGNCINANVTNIRPEAVARSSGVAPTSSAKGPLRTARNARKNWLST